MNLCEAVQYGPNFKIRRGGYRWIMIDVVGDSFTWGEGLVFYPTPADLLATDWEVDAIGTQAGSQDE